MPREEGFPKSGVKGSMGFGWAMLLVLLLAVAPASRVAAQEEVQPEISTENRLYQQAMVEAERASTLERRGKKAAAVDAYEFAGRVSEASIAEAVLQLNPTYKPAEQALAEINKLEQRENELFTPQGKTLDTENRRKALKEVVSTLRLVRDIVTLGR